MTNGPGLGIADSLSPTPTGMPDTTVKVREVFGFASDLVVPAFTMRTDHVPAIDTTYQFDRHTTLAETERLSDAAASSVRMAQGLATTLGLHSGDARVTRDDARAAVGTLDQLPALVEQVQGGPAILIIGEVVAHSAPWRRQNVSTFISHLLEAAE